MLELASGAQKDIRLIFQWLTRRSPHGARAWYAELRNTLAKIENAKDAGSSAPEAERIGLPLRQLLFKTRKGRWYRAVFVDLETHVRVLRIRGPGQRLLRTNDIPEA